MQLQKEAIGGSPNEMEVLLEERITNGTPGRRRRKICRQGSFGFPDLRGLARRLGPDCSLTSPSLSLLARMGVRLRSKTILCWIANCAPAARFQPSPILVTIDSPAVTQLGCNLVKSGRAMAAASNTHPCGITGVHYDKKFLEDVEGSAPKLAGMLGLADSSMVWKRQEDEEDAAAAGAAHRNKCGVCDVRGHSAAECRLVAGLAVLGAIAQGTARARGRGHDGWNVWMAPSGQQGPPAAEAPAAEAPDAAPAAPAAPAAQAPSGAPNAGFAFGQIPVPLRPRAPENDVEMNDESGLCGASGAVAGAETSPAIFHKRELVQEYPELNRWPLNKVLPSGGHMTI
ncbi:hypothetical protein HFD88_009173 [Aspergillus terreus]|nr:hypothetical protein HFD88_009173 [Aspergillus terreus]